MIKEFICPDRDLIFPDYEAMEGVDLASAEGIYKFCKGNNNSPLLELPFDHNIMAEALGGEPVFDSKFGYRIAGPICTSLDDCLALKDLEKMDFSGRATAEKLKALSMLKDDGEKLLVEISGPVGVLDGLIGISTVFKALRKDRQTIDSLFKRLNNYILQYTELLAGIGVDVISFADPSIGVSIVGEKVLRDLIDSYYYPLLLGIYERARGRSLIHLCPKFYLSFKDLGLIEEEILDLGEEMTYGDALLSLDNNYMTGSRCINHQDIKVSSIRKLSFTKID